MPNIQIHDYSLSWLGIGTSRWQYKSGGVKLDLCLPLNEMTHSYMSHRTQQLLTLQEHQCLWWGPLYDFRVAPSFIKIKLKFSMLGSSYTIVQCSTLTPVFPNKWILCPLKLYECCLSVFNYITRHILRLCIFNTTLEHLCSPSIFGGILLFIILLLCIVFFVVLASFCVLCPMVSVSLDYPLTNVPSLF